MAAAMLRRIKRHFSSGQSCRMKRKKYPRALVSMSATITVFLSNAGTFDWLHLFEEVIVRDPDVGWQGRYIRCHMRWILKYQALRRRKLLLRCHQVVIPTAANIDQEYIFFFVALQELLIRRKLFNLAWPRVSHDPLD